MSEYITESIGCAGCEGVSGNSGRSNYGDFAGEGDWGVEQACPGDRSLRFRHLTREHAIATARAWNASPRRGGCKWAVVYDPRSASLPYHGLGEGATGPSITAMDWWKLPVIASVPQIPRWGAAALALLVFKPWRLVKNRRHNSRRRNSRSLFPDTARLHSTAKALGHKDVQLSRTPDDHRAWRTMGVDTKSPPGWFSRWYAAGYAGL